MSKLSICTGFTEDFNEILQVILVVPNLEIPIEFQATPLEYLDLNGFIDEVGKALNLAKLVANPLGLDIILEEDVEDCAEEIKEGLYNRLVKIYGLNKS